MKRPKSVTVVLPAQGVEGAIASVVRDLAVAAYALRSRQMALDVLLLAGDADRTAAIATATARQLGLDLTAVPAPEEGPGQAFLDGFRQAAHYGPADLVVTMDATGHHDATQIPHLIDRLMEQELHVVIGSRWARGAGTPGLSARRWALGRAANSVFRTLTGAGEIRDATTSFRVARVGEGPIIYWPAVRPRRPELHNAADVGRFIEHLVSLWGEVRRTRRARLGAPGRTFTDDHFGAADDP